MKVLVIQPKIGMGDMVIYLPYIHAISKKYQTPVSILVKENSRANQLLAEDKHIKEILILDRAKNNSGSHDGLSGFFKLIKDLKSKEFDKVFNVNAKSVYYCGKFFVPKMKKLKKGVILNVASTAGLSPRPKLNWYNASKGWMITATKAMAIELAPYKVRVNAIAPVAGITPLLKSFMGGDTPKKKQAFLSTIPIGRFSTPQDMGNAACFLCSDEATMITGTILEVDGGRCI